MADRRDPLQFTRRDFGKLALAGLPLSLAFADINSKFKGVQIGAITYSFRSMPNPEDIIKAYVTLGLGEMELMSGDAEKLAGAPIPMTGRGGRGPGGPPAGAAAAGTSSPAAPGDHRCSGGKGSRSSRCSGWRASGGRGRTSGWWTPHDHARGTGRSRRTRRGAPEVADVFDRGDVQTGEEED